jgi:hypothetical protein
MVRGFMLILVLTCTAVVSASGLTTGDVGTGSPMECDAGDLGGIVALGRCNIESKGVPTGELRDIVLFRTASIFGPNEGIYLESVVAGSLGVMAQSVECDESDVIQTITERCTPSGDLIVIRLINLVGCTFLDGYGGILRHCGSVGGVQWERCHPDDH